MFAEVYRWKWRALICGASVVLGFAGGWRVRDLTADAAEARKAVEMALAAAARAQASQQQVVAANRISASVGIASAERQMRIRTQTKEIIREIPNHVSSQSDDRCSVPVGFVRLHDAAAAGSADTLSDATGASHDAPSGVALSAVTETVAGNYGTCREDAERLRSLQQWIIAQSALWDGNIAPEPRVNRTRAGAPGFE